ncbi:MAG: type II secretion system protein, partial [Planctomycetota bacterium]
MGAALFSQRGRGWCAFSLVELLVVVSIITVLMSIMLPALKRSLRQAASTVCMHNLRAIDQMMQMYRMESR